MKTAAGGPIREKKGWERNGEGRRNKLTAFLSILGAWAVQASGCTWAFSKDTIVRCPKCSTAFSVEDADIRLKQLRE